MNEVEAVARAIAPSRWEVMDHYLAQTKRKYDGENAAYDPDQFKDRESMVTAQASIAALDAARGDAEPVAWLYGAPRRAPFKGFEARASHSRWPDWMQTGWTETPLYAHQPARGDQVARVVEWLRDDADQTEVEATRIVKNTSGNARQNAAEWSMLVRLKRGLADAIERGDPFNG